MKTISTPKLYSWLQLPVSLRNSTDADLHLTVKFFGAVRVNPVVVATKLKYYIFRVGEFRSPVEWVPTIFNDIVYVLEFTKYPMDLAEAHGQFSLIADQFSPWRPHISVPLKYWEWVKETKANPISENLQFGEPELYIGGGINVKGNPL